MKKITVAKQLIKIAKQFSLIDSYEQLYKIAKQLNKIQQNQKQDRQSGDLGKTLGLSPNQSRVVDKAIQTQINKSISKIPKSTPKSKK